MTNDFDQAIERRGSGCKKKPAPLPERRTAARDALSLSDAALFRECRAEFLVAGGPGGQHRNKTESGVRLMHEATGITVSATERRSQRQNRAVALARLRKRLVVLARTPRVRRPTQPSRGATERRLVAKKKHGQRKAMRTYRPAPSNGDLG